jgi:uncharacterized protein YciI
MKGDWSMLFALIGYLKPGAGPVPQSVQVLGNDFLGQPFTKIHSAGPLRDAAGDRAGMLMVFESESREAAEAFIQGSPYIEAGLVEDHRLYEYANEVG